MSAPDSRISVRCNEIHASEWLCDSNSTANWRETGSSTGAIDFVLEKLKVKESNRKQTQPLHNWTVCHSPYIELINTFVYDPSIQSSHFGSGHNTNTQILLLNGEHCDSCAALKKRAQNHLFVNNLFSAQNCCRWVESHRGIMRWIHFRWLKVIPCGWRFAGWLPLRRPEEGTFRFNCVIQAELLGHLAALECEIRLQEISITARNEDRFEINLNIARMKWLSGAIVIQMSYGCVLSEYFSDLISSLRPLDSARISVTSQRTRSSHKGIRPGA